MPQSLAFNMDCMKAMKEFPDQFFDLAVVDPPYGAGFSENGGCQDNSQFVNRGGWHGKQKYHLGTFATEECSDNRTKHRVIRTGGTWATKYAKNIISWDVAPEQDYFEELFRISRNQIIWGGNYFSLPPTRCFLVWRKLTISEKFSMAMAEYAWTSFNSNAKVFEYMPQDLSRFHPTQKPVALYAWIFKNYAKQGDKIIDTHLGSGSSRIAAYNAGLDFWGYEIDETYFKLEEERFDKHTAQQNLFLME